MRKADLLHTAATTNESWANKERERNLGGYDAAHGLLCWFLYSCGRQPSFLHPEGIGTSTISSRNALSCCLLTWCVLIGSFFRPSLHFSCLCRYHAPLRKGGRCDIFCTTGQIRSTGVFTWTRCSGLSGSRCETCALTTAGLPGDACVHANGRLCERPFVLVDADHVCVALCCLAFCLARV